MCKLYVIELIPHCYAGDTQLRVPEKLTLFGKLFGNHLPMIVATYEIKISLHAENYYRLTKFATAN